MADAISQVLYPEDNHYEGKSLRLKQQYFFVSATIQSITRKHIQQYGTLRNFHEKNVIQINDTHPTLVIPELMRHDDLGGQQVGVLDVVDGLACRLNAKLIGIDVHGRQRRVGDAGEQRVVKGYDGQIFRDAQAQLAAELFQYHRKNVIADQNRCRAVRSGKQRFQGGFIGIIQGIDLHTVPFPRGDVVLEQRHLIAAFPLGRKQHGIADPKIGDAAVAQFIEVVGGFLARQCVVIVDIDGLVGRLRCLAHNDMEQPLAAQIGSHRTIFFGVEQDESIGLRVGYHALDRIQHFGIVLAGDDGVYITALVAELPDAPDDLQMKGIFIYVPLGGRQDDADGLGKCFGRFGLKIWFIAHLRHDAADAFFCVPADGWAVLAGVTEPLEFMFMFCAMPLYIVYAILQGCAFAMAGIIHLRLHSFGNLEFITRIPMSLQAGLGGDIINFVLCVVAFFLIGYFVAYFMIGRLNLATPGRLGNYTDDNANDAAADTKTEKKADKKADNGQAERIIALLGGRENIVLVDACMTRLRVTVKDPAKVADLAAWKAEGALSLLVKGDGIQAVYGPKADVLKSDINDIL